MTQSPFSEPELLILKGKRDTSAYSSSHSQLQIAKKIFVYVLANAYIAYILASSTGFSILMLSKGDAAETGFPEHPWKVKVRANSICEGF